MNRHQVRVLEALSRVKTFANKGLYREASKVIDLVEEEENLTDGEREKVMSTLTEEHISFCEEQMKNFSLGATKSSSS